MTVTPYMLDANNVVTNITESGVNSYVNLADTQQYMTDRGYAQTLIDLVTDGVVLRSADYINLYAQRYLGVKSTGIINNMQWPRAGVLLYGLLVPNDVIPDLIRDAQMETAHEIVSDRDPVATMPTQIVSKQTVGPIEIEYDTNAGTEIPGYEYIKISALLRPVLKDMFRVSR